MNTPDPEGSRNAGAMLDALATIRSATAQCHSAMERDVNWAKAFSTPGRYVGLLRRFNRVVKPLERRLAALASPASNFSAEMRSTKLHNDIESVENHYRINDDDVADNQFVFTESFVVDHDSAWGVRYVLEGSGLGGQILSRELQASRVNWPECLSGRSSLDDRCPTIDSYFVGRGADTGLYWRKFCRELNQQLCDERAVSLASRAAVETFEFFHLSLSER